MLSPRRNFCGSGDQIDLPNLRSVQINLYRESLAAKR